MALDFPANPVDGEVFGSYVWSTAKGVWQSREESAAPAVVSPVPPTSPNTGDIWVDSSDGVSYVYYDDGSSGQWIEMISSGVVALDSKADKTYVDTQDSLKANLASPTFSGTLNAEFISASQRVIGTTPVNNGSTGGVAIKAPPSGAQTSAYLQFVNNAYSSQLASIEATASGSMNVSATNFSVSGTLLSPSQPLFSGTDTRAINLTSAVLNSSNCFNQIDYNVGNCFNASTGRFTATVAGYYDVSLHVGDTASTTTNVRIRKNGASNVGPLAEAYNQTGNGSINVMVRSFVYCAVGDYIDFEAARINSLAGVQHKRFLIRLLQ
jgi:hypothetical protein